MNPNKYFRELALSLQQEGFTTGPEVIGLLPVALDGERLCIATESGSIRYRTEAVGGEARRAVLDKVTDIAGITAGYMRQMEAAPILRASGLSEEFKLLADFNGSVLAGLETKFCWPFPEKGDGLFLLPFFGMPKYKF